MNDIALIESNETSHSSENVGRHSFLKAVVFYLILLLLVFSHCLSYPLLDWDDAMHLTQNPYLNPDSPGNLGTTLQKQGQHIQATPRLLQPVRIITATATNYRSSLCVEYGIETGPRKIGAGIRYPKSN
ncbi:hypothetical protein [Gimesia maris]|uniref:hypothetical protein n=1 Tax=Gimesia maris TaxID=122 RepID=UPI0032EB4CCB